MIWTKKTLLWNAKTGFFPLHTLFQESSPFHTPDLLLVVWSCTSFLALWNGVMGRKTAFFSVLDLLKGPLMSGVR